MKVPLSLDFIYYCHVGKFRLQMELSAVVMSERIGISRSHLHKIENNELIPSVATAIRIARFLEKPIGEVFEVKENDG